MAGGKINFDYLIRFDLVRERIAEIPGEAENACFYPDFFIKKAEYILKVIDSFDRYTLDEIGSVSITDLKARNMINYSDVLPENYDNSYSNPDYADEKLGIYGGILSFVSAELQMLPAIMYGHGKKTDDDICEMEEALILMELFVYLYGLFCGETKPTLKDVEKQIYYHAFDYIENIAGNRMYETLTPNYECIANEIIYGADLSNPNYLFMYGEYISDTEIKLSEFLSSMSEEEIDDLAKVYTDGFRRGFDVMGVDFTGKKTVNIRYHLGQERIVRAAVKRFAAMGLEPIFAKCATSRLVRRGVVRSGYESSSVNMQFEYDHRLDDRFFLDAKFVKRRLDATKDFYEELKDEAAVYAGPAVIETFGEELFSPVVKDSVEGYTEEQQKLSVEMMNKLGMISNKYLPGDSYSFTIIAFPLPDIGDDFENIFRETARINTLDNDTYIKIQQSIIDVLDVADIVKVEGMNGNETDIAVKMRKLENPDKETQFENCTADVNIPLGEVFTSPVLKGTKGLLNVSKVYLNGYSFENLKLHFEDGVVKDYSCDNFIGDMNDSLGHDDTEAAIKGKRYIKENILFNHEFLPLGEFAIGTNTTAYTMARKYDILEKLPILIVEKTGPHFAVGDTCYSHAEDHKVYNPDGKEIISRENDFSILRDTEPEKAYFNCHTDVTIPYNELGRLYTVDSDGNETDIIVEGRFVLPGTEALNTALD